MEFGLNLYSLGGQIQTEEGFLDTLIKLKNMGYSFVQLSGRPLDADMTKRVSEKAGMPIVLTHSAYAKTKEEIKELVDKHKKFGCDRVGLGFKDYRDMPEEDVLAFIQELKQYADNIEAEGARFFYHNHHYEFMKLSDGLTIYDHIIQDAPNVNLIMDTYWLQTGGVNILDYIEKGKGRIECVHLKDYKVTFDKANGNVFKARYAPIGDGNINWKKVIPALINAGAKYLLVEQDDATTYDDPFAQVERSIKYLKENF